jgi:hypothetical protein
MGRSGALGTIGAFGLEFSLFCLLETFEIMGYGSVQEVLLPKYCDEDINCMGKEVSVMIPAVVLPSGTSGCFGSSSRGGTLPRALGCQQ